jgi:hypothetical protein
MAENAFNIPVRYKGEDLNFEAHLLKFGYIYQIQVVLNGVVVVYEPDEEETFRASVDPRADGADKVEPTLVKAIAEVLQQARL